MAAHNLQLRRALLHETDLLYYGVDGRDRRGDATSAGPSMAHVGVAAYSAARRFRFPANGSRCPPGAIHGKRRLRLPESSGDQAVSGRWVRKAAETGARGYLGRAPFLRPVPSWSERGLGMRCASLKERFREWTGHDMPRNLTDEVFAFGSHRCGRCSGVGRRGESDWDCERSLPCAKPLAEPVPGDIADGSRDWVAATMRHRTVLQFGMSDWDSAASIPASTSGHRPYWFLLSVDPRLYARLSGKA